MEKIHYRDSKKECKKNLKKWGDYTKILKNYKMDNLCHMI